MTWYTEQALSMLHEWVQSEVLRKHCYAVAASMRHFAQLNGADADIWGAVGLLHDLDFEQYPQMPPPGDLPAAAAAAILAGAAASRCSRCTRTLGWRISSSMAGATRCAARSWRMPIKRRAARNSAGAHAGGCR